MIRKVSEPYLDGGGGFSQPAKVALNSQPMHIQLVFPTGRDSETFRDNGTEVPSLSRDRGTTEQAKNLAKGRDGSGQPKSGTGQARIAKNRDRTQDKTVQSRKGHSKTEKGCYKTEKDFLKQERMF
mgnify:CR=1 FL=1